MLDYRYYDWYVDVLKAAMEIPATDRIVAGIKANGVDMLLEKYRSRWISPHVEDAERFAKQLREVSK